MQDRLQIYNQIEALKKLREGLSRFQYEVKYYLINSALDRLNEITALPKETVDTYVKYHIAKDTVKCDEICMMIQNGPIRYLDGQIQRLERYLRESRSPF